MYLTSSQLIGFFKILIVFLEVSHIKLYEEEPIFPIWLIKSGTQNYKVDVMHLSWMLPVLHPSLPIATQLEAELTKKVEQLKAGLGKGMINN